MASQVKPCCLVPENRVLVKQNVALQADGTGRPVEQRQCSVCGCNHYRLFATQVLEPGSFKVG